MRIARFSPPKEVSASPLFGVVLGNEIEVLAGDPLYSGITKTGEKLALDSVKLLAPVIPRSKVVCVGKNYADHAKEMDSVVPEQPVIFIKPNTSVIGPDDAIVWPSMSKKVDHEAELAIVIGKICKDVPKERVQDVIFGYTIGNDVTARDLQKVDGQWSRAKGFDTFCPLGPWIETDIDPSDLAISAEVDGQMRQSDRTSSMIFDIPTIIHFITQVYTLLPGDVILTGTPAGVGVIPVGSTVSISIEGIGTLSNRAVADV
jgi:2-keto-4-pentenoate hydratase/2-oxohepta-3-ene-1,7-dioic acid hydratase in catechol pathway